MAVRKEAAVLPREFFEPLLFWTSLRGNEYPIYARLKTPIGTFYVSPMVENQEVVRIDGSPLWEGATLVRKDSSDGPVVGRMYLEVFDSLPGCVTGMRLMAEQPLARKMPRSGMR